MSHKKQTPARLVGILVLGAALSGCNYNTANDGIRNGPQAVHPSAGVVYGGPAAAPSTGSAQPLATCGTPGQAACYTPQPGDGSQPIID